MTQGTQEFRLELCQAPKSQLLVIDVQDRLCAAMPHDCLELAFSNIHRLILSARELEIPLIGTEQYPKGLGPTRETITTSLPEGFSFCNKTSFSSCGASGFEGRLQGKESRPQIILAGLEAHICVLQTAAGLQHWGYHVFVVSDAICSRSPQNRENAISRMRQCGITVTNTESVVFEWLGNSEHPKFREISRLFR
ncbi:MAG: isochorismatase family protein [Gammaproteobacteria bacterium]|nr:isochorismatase family protein [Gammaproteobacteria bacterium]MBU1656271.1 isochorismatase family protein [Gammaproteobacteria bacterium]MBU1959836.1 isochorismatase family protein [Gammaproteobacteria bacterium]